MVRVDPLDIARPYPRTQQGLRLQLRDSARRLRVGPHRPAVSQRLPGTRQQSLLLAILSAATTAIRVLSQQMMDTARTHLRWISRWWTPLRNR